MWRNHRQDDAATPPTEEQLDVGLKVCVPAGTIAFRFGIEIRPRPVGFTAKSLKNYQEAVAHQQDGLLAHWILLAQSATLWPAHFIE